MSLANRTVLVVEDHEFQRRTMLQILANLGAGRLLEAADGESALDQLGDRDHADVVVCDLDMPGMDGVEFLRHLAARGIDTSVVIVSGLDDAVLAAAQETARAYGVDVLGVVRKPLTARRLLEVIGLHRLSADDPHQANGRHVSAWREALSGRHADVQLTPRVDLLAGGPAGVRVAAQRAPGAEAGNDLGVPIPPDVIEGLIGLTVHAAAQALRGDATIVLPTGAFDHLDLADLLARAASIAGVAPERLCVALPRCPEAPLAPRRMDVLTRLRIRGFGLGLEQFASGDAIAGLPLTEVALTRGAASAALASREDTAALEATIATLHERDIRVVATGCRSAAELELLGQAGCDRAEPPATA